MFRTFCRNMRVPGHGRKFAPDASTSVKLVALSYSNLFYRGSAPAGSHPCRYLSSERKEKDVDDGLGVPEASFDVDSEDKKEFLELSTSAAVDGGLAQISSRHRKVSYKHLNSLHKMDTGLGEISTTNESEIFESLRGQMSNTIDDDEISVGDDELLSLHDSYKIDGPEGKTADGFTKGEEEKMMELFKSTDSLLDDYSGADHRFNGAEGTDEADKEGSFPRYQDFPRNGSEMDEYFDVDKNPNSFPGSSWAERRKMHYEYSKHMIGSYNEDDDDDSEEAIDQNSILHGHFNPRAHANYYLPTRTTDNYPEPLLDQFIPDTAQEKFRYDNQGNRACPGHRQRKGKEGKLYCHRIDLSTLHYLDVINMSRFITHDSEIMDRKTTGLCSKCQRKVAKTVKRARNFGILPRIGEYVLQDSQPRRKKPFHVMR